MSKPRRRLRRLIVTLLLLGLGMVGLFVLNGTTGWRAPQMSETQQATPKAPVTELRVMAYNIAKCFAYTGATSFRETKAVKACLDEIAKVIQDARADLVFLSEVVFECGPAPVNQVEHLAQATGLVHWSYGDNFSYGLPFFRIRAGNAVLSRFPLKGVQVQQLVPGAPFYKPTNNRRLLWVDVQLADRTLRAGAVRNDSFSLKNNHRQVEQILKLLDQEDPSKRRPTLLAGDFNAELSDPSMQTFLGSGRFITALNGPPTFPAGPGETPRRKIDFVLAPKRWRLIEHRVVQDQPSDHLPILSVFELSKSER